MSMEIQQKTREVDPDLRVSLVSPPEGTYPIFYTTVQEEDQNEKGEKTLSISGLFAYLNPGETSEWRPGWEKMHALGWISFQDAPTLPDVGWAVKRMNEGRRISRHSWNGPGQWVKKQVPDEHSKMTEPYAYLHNAQGGLIPWTPSQGDLFATDYYIVEGDPAD